MKCKSSQLSLTGALNLTDCQARRMLTGKQRGHKECSLAACLDHRQLSTNEVSTRENLRRGNKTRAAEYAGGGNVTWRGSHVDWEVSRDIGRVPRDRLSSPSCALVWSEMHASRVSSRARSHCVRHLISEEGVGYTGHSIISTDLPTSLQRAHLRRYSVCVVMSDDSSGDRTPV